jgi:hypothetical protein
MANQLLQKHLQDVRAAADIVVTAGEAPAGDADSGEQPAAE